MFLIPELATASLATKVSRAPSWAAPRSLPGRPSSARRPSPATPTGSPVTRHRTTSKVSKALNKHYPLLSTRSFETENSTYIKRTSIKCFCWISWELSMMDIFIGSKLCSISANGTVAHYGGLSDDALSLSVKNVSLLWPVTTHDTFHIPGLCLLAPVQP